MAIYKKLSETRGNFKSIKVGTHPGKCCGDMKPGHIAATDSSSDMPVFEKKLCGGDQILSPQHVA